MSLLDLIDLKDSKACLVRFNGKEIDLVGFRKKGDKIYAIPAGQSKKGYEIDQITYEKLDKELDDHFKKHLFIKR